MYSIMGLTAGQTAHPKPPFLAYFRPDQRQLLFLTAKTADSGLENKNILKLDELLDQKTGVQNGRPTTARVLSPASKVTGRDQVVISTWQKLFRV